MHGLGPQYEIVRYHPGQRGELLNLVRQFWGSDQELSAAYFAWKYEANPYAAPPQVYLVRYQGELVGIRGFMGSTWEAEGLDVPQLLFCSSDMAIVPLHRGKGLAAGMLGSFCAALDRGRVPCVLSLSANAAARISALKSGWCYVAPFLNLRRPATTRPAQGIPFQVLDRESVLASVPGSEISVTHTPRVEAMAGLVERIGYDGRIRLVRDSTYFGWRFRNPRVTYRFCYLDRDGARAYLVLQTKVSSPGTVRILDWEGESAEDRRELLLAVLAQIDDRIEVRRSGFTPTDRALLESVGFVEAAEPAITDTHSALLVYPLETQDQGRSCLIGQRNGLEFGQWDYRELYSDGG
jgi:hypothetical protein